MPRWALPVLVALAVAGLGVVLYRATRRVPEHAPPAKSASVAASALPSAASSAELQAWEEPSSDVPAHPFNGYDTLPDGRKVTALSSDAPKMVSFGVVLVTYRGAERAPNNARQKAEALEMAKRLAGEAKANFEETVKKGDPGSNADAGSVPQGVLEPVLEFVLFTMKKGEVYSDPIDTPRGYWIVRRNP
jgi:hypothetical protein